MPARRGVLAFVLSLVVLGLALVVVLAWQLRNANLPATQPGVLVFDVPATLSEGDTPAGSLFFPSAAAARPPAPPTTWCTPCTRRPGTGT